LLKVTSPPLAVGNEKSGAIEPVGTSFALTGMDFSLAVV
jgi:hypothetical protein